MLMKFDVFQLDVVAFAILCSCKAKNKVLFVLR